MFVVHTDSMYRKINVRAVQYCMASIVLFVVMLMTIAIVSYMTGERKEIYYHPLQCRLDSNKVILKSIILSVYQCEEAVNRIDQIVDIIKASSRKVSQINRNKVVRYRIAFEIYRMSNCYPNITDILICAVIRSESYWQSKIKSKVGARGLMQLMPSTGQWLAAQMQIKWTGTSMLYDPIMNIRLGCKYLSDLTKLYGREGALIAYNGGTVKANLWVRRNRDYSCLWKETQIYVPTVLKYYKSFNSM